MSQLCHMNHSHKCDDLLINHAQSNYECSYVDQFPKFEIACEGQKVMKFIFCCGKLMQRFDNETKIAKIDYRISHSVILREFEIWADSINKGYALTRD